MGLHYIIIFLLIIFCSCESATDKTTPKIKKKNINKKKLKPIEEYINKHINALLPYIHYPDYMGYRVLDSLQLNSLKSTLFYVGDPNAFDDDDYIIIRDNQSKQHFKMVIIHWPTYNRNLPDDLQLKVIENNENGKVLKPVNYEINGLEYFLNNCSALENKNLDPASVDTIIRFYSNEFVKINSPSEVDSLINIRLKSNKDQKNDFIAWTEKKRKILKEKVKRKNVLLYRLKYKWSTGFDYFEINPGWNGYNYPDLKYSKSPVDTIFLTSRIPGNNYNIVYVRL